MECFESRRTRTPIDFSGTARLYPPDDSVIKATPPRFSFPPMHCISCGNVTVDDPLPSLAPPELPILSLLMHGPAFSNPPYPRRSCRWFDRRKNSAPLTPFFLASICAERVQGPRLKEAPAAFLCALIRAPFLASPDRAPSCPRGRLGLSFLSRLVRSFDANPEQERVSEQLSHRPPSPRSLLSCSCIPLD